MIDRRALALFREGKDTKDIADILRLPVSCVVRMIEAARREPARLDQMAAQSLDRGRVRGAAASAAARRNKHITLPTCKFLEGST